MPESDWGKPATAAIQASSENVIAAVRVAAVRMQQRRWKRGATNEDWDASMAVETGKTNSDVICRRDNINHFYQVENSRQMYRAIMEEVARYLEKCHTNFELLQQRERDKVIERSKSIANIAKSRVAELGANDGRARSSTNLLNLNTLQPQKQQKSGTLLSDISYSAFKDFTW